MSNIEYFKKVINSDITKDNIIFDDSLKELINNKNKIFLPSLEGLNDKILFLDNKQNNNYKSSTIKLSESISYKSLKDKYTEFNFLEDNRNISTLYDLIGFISIHILNLNIIYIHYIYLGFDNYLKKILNKNTTPEIYINSKLGIYTEIINMFKTDIEIKTHFEKLQDNLDESIQKKEIFEIVEYDNVKIELDDLKSNLAVLQILILLKSINKININKNGTLDILPFLKASNAKMNGLINMFSNNIE